MLDHMPEQYPLPGIAYGQRWVSTPACRGGAGDQRAAARRRCTTSRCYLMTEPVEEHAARVHTNTAARSARSSRFHRHATRVAVGSVPRARRRARRIGCLDLAPSRCRSVRTAASTSSSKRPARPTLHAHEAALMRDPPVWPGCGPSVPARRRTLTRGSRATSASRWPGSTQEPNAVAAELAPIERSRTGVTFVGPFETITPWEWDVVRRGPEPTSGSALLALQQGDPWP